MHQTEWRFKNKEVTPPLLIVSLSTASTSKWNTNVVYDWGDEEEAYFDEDLTPEEKGHVYLWKEGLNTLVHVNMPYRIMDQDTGKLVSGLRSFKTTKKCLARRQTEQALRNPRLCISDFQLTQDDFYIFKERVLSFGGHLRKDTIDLDDLLKSIDALQNRVSGLFQRIHNHRDSVCRPTSILIITDTSINEIMETFSLFREEIREISAVEHKPITDALVKLNSELGRQTDYVRATAKHDDLVKALKEFSSFDFSRMEREALHKYRVDTGKESSTERPSHVGSLRAEMDSLRAYYPALSKIVVVSDDKVTIDLSGVTIILSKEGVRVEGDPLALKPYISDVGAIQSEGRKRRKRIINAKSEK